MGSLQALAIDILQYLNYPIRIHPSWKAPGYSVTPGECGQGGDFSKGGAPSHVLSSASQ